MSAKQPQNPERESLSVVFLEYIKWHGDIQPESPDGANATEMASQFMVSEWDNARDFGVKLADRIFATLHLSIPWDEIDTADRDLAREGATFHWKVGYLEIDGQRLSVSHIEFRRAQNFTPREQATAKAKAAEFTALFDA